MHGTEQQPGEAQLSVGWEDGFAEQDDQSLERAAAYAVTLTRRLTAEGYQPRRLDVALRRGARGVLEMSVRGDVPRMPLDEFVRLARATLQAANLALGVGQTHDLLMRATLESRGVAPVTPAWPRAAHPVQQRTRLASLPLRRLATGLALGGLLGVLGLPRLELAFLASSAQPQRAVVVVRDTPVPAQDEPTTVPALPTATIAPSSTATLSGPRVLFAERFVSPRPNWPNNPNGPAWFADGGFRMFARQPGRFVAVGVPLPQAIGTAVLSAQFHKVGGPLGGGYGLIVRDQGQASERDGRGQTGHYMVLEVGDRGDVGIWQRKDSRWVDIMPWTHSDAVHPDREPNALVVTLRGSALRFEVNGQVVADLTHDGIPPQGGVGVFVGGDLNEVVLEWLRIEIS
jgi:hypothetical protein